jgi:hypothetical protein
VSARIGDTASVSLRVTGVYAANKRLAATVASSTLRHGRLEQNLRALTSSYGITASGIEQTFSVNHYDKVAGQLVVTFESPERWSTARGGSAIVPRIASSHLMYGELRTVDASGKTLPSRFVLSATGPQIRIDSTGAAYPITIDPTWMDSSTPLATLSSAGNVGDYFGFSCALSADGTTALIGAPNANSNNGRAYVFHVTSETAWSGSVSPVATLDDSGTNPDYFGQSVSLSADGTVAAIGAVGVNSYDGAVFIYGSTSEAWTSPTFEADIPGSAESGQEFGWSVALSSDGTLLLVGAPFNFGGEVVVFNASSESTWASWNFDTELFQDSVAYTANPNAAFGFSVAVSSDGTTVLVGAPGPAPGNGRGAAYIFNKPSEGAWSVAADPTYETATLTVSSFPNTSNLGYAVALSADGTTALAGAPNGAGVAVIFRASSEASWGNQTSATATLTATVSSSANLGASVSLSSDGATALVGAPHDDTIANVNTGAAFVFSVASESSWATTSTPTATLINGAGGITDHFGDPGVLTPDGSIALLGADGANEATGAAYIYNAVTPQTINFTSSPPSNATVGGPTYTVTATGGGSANPVTFTIDPSASGVCTIAVAVVSLIGAGTCTIDANQAGNNFYAAAPQVQQSFAVTQSGGGGGGPPPPPTGTSCTGGASCSANESVPGEKANVTGTSSTDATIFLGNEVTTVDCGPGFNISADFITLSEYNFISSAPLTVTDTLKGAHHAIYVICYQDPTPFKDSAGSVVTSGLLPFCNLVSNVAPCEVSSKATSKSVIVTFKVPPGDPRFHAVNKHPRFHQPG